MKMTFGIRGKLFVMIIIIITLMSLIQVLFQTFLMEDFYLDKLSTGVEKDLYSVESSLQDVNMNDVDSVRLSLNDIRSNIDQPLHIASSLNPEYAYDVSGTLDSYIAFQPNDSESVYNIPVSDEITSYISQNPNVTNDIVFVEGYASEAYGEILADQVKISDISYINDEYDDIVDGAMDILENNDSNTLDMNSEEFEDLYEGDWKQIKTEGHILYYQIGSYLNSDYEYNEEILLNQIYDLAYTGQLKDKSEDVQIIQFLDSYTNKNNLILYKRLDLDEASPSNEIFFVFSIISYASLEEPLSIYQQYNWMTMIVGTILAFVLVFLFTGKMVKPIKDMERVTSKMANLNFDERIQPTSKDEIGQLANSFNVLSDRLKHSIDDMQSLNVALELEVQERTKQQDILKEFIANASHELKTPITIMKGLMDGVEDGIYDPNTSEHKISVQDEVGRMEKIVYDLLQVSKMERGAQQVQLSIFEPSDLIYSTYQRHKRHGVQKGMTFNFDFEDAFVNADAQLIESVVDNLINNAIKYSSDGADVNCKIHTFGNKVYVSIENTLSHIPDEDLSKIFEPFYRVDKSHTRKTGGSGLGLSIIKNILDIHNSEFELINTQNGVKFTFTLNLVNSEE